MQETVQADSGAQSVVAQLKAQTERTERQVLQEETIVIRNLYQMEEDIWRRRTPKTAKDGFPPDLPLELFALTLRWRPKRMAE